LKPTPLHNDHVLESAMHSGDVLLMSFQFEVTARMGIKRTSNRFELSVALRTPILKAAISRFASLFYLVTAALE
jgi:hypothetical protein